MSVRIIVGDARTALAELDAGSVQTCVTSPPYFGLRDYGHEVQIGLEQTPEAYVSELVAVFREVRRVLKDDGTLWLNLGDSYCTNAGQYGGLQGRTGQRASRRYTASIASRKGRAEGAKPKDLLLIPSRVALALQADGWYVRSDVIWSKQNPIPESVTDRPTKAHEYVFLLSKRSRYYYDGDAIREPLAPSSVARLSQPTLAQQAGSDRVPGKTNGPMKAVPPRRSGNKERTYGDDRGRPGSHLAGNVPWEDDGTGRNARTVWTIATQPFKGSHFATMPPALAERCIKAGSRPGDTVLDPFGGAGTTGLAADRIGRDAVLVELNPEYAEMARARIKGEAPLFWEDAA
jgi:DNA modification methylase